MYKVLLKLGNNIKFEIPYKKVSLTNTPVLPNTIIVGGLVSFIARMRKRIWSNKENLITARIKDVYNESDKNRVRIIQYKTKQSVSKAEFIRCIKLIK